MRCKCRTPIWDKVAVKQSAEQFLLLQNVCSVLLSAMGWNLCTFHFPFKLLVISWLNWIAFQTICYTHLRYVFLHYFCCPHQSVPSSLIPSCFFLLFRRFLSNYDWHFTWKCKWSFPKCNINCFDHEEMRN